MDYMSLAIEEALKAMEKGEIPVGAVIVKDGKILAVAHNEKEGEKDPTAHAEILAIKKACEELGDWRLNGAEMYVTLEPCPMCASAITQSRISKLYIGTYNKDMGACGTIINLIDDSRLNSFVDVVWEYDEECKKILTSFFEKRRKESN
ncbi:MAG: nucleoside deaminase [Clostridium sp.]